jgi:hypothetical protein
MLDVILKLLDKFIKLGEVREANAQRYFDRYVTPLYLAAEIIYKDYSALLRDVRRRIETGRKTLPLIQFLERRRLKELPNRMKIRAILRKTPQRNWTWFEQGILGLIHGCVSDFDIYQSIYPLEHRKDHTVYNLIHFIEQKGYEDLALYRPSLLERVDHQIAGIDKAWEFVCQGYANLQSTTFSNLSVPRSFTYNRSGDESPKA